MLSHWLAVCKDLLLKVANDLRHRVSGFGFRVRGCGLGFGVFGFQGLLAFEAYGQHLQPLAEGTGSILSPAKGVPPPRQSPPGT